MRRFVFILPFVVGCGDGGPRYEPVTGRAVVAGKPLTGGTVSFRPAAGNPTRHHPTGRIAADGTYTLVTAGVPGAPAGKYKVLVFSDANADAGKATHPAPPKWRTNVKYTAEATTDLIADVVPSPAPGRYDLNLTD